MWKTYEQSMLMILWPTMSNINIKSSMQSLKHLCKGFFTQFVSKYIPLWHPVTDRVKYFLILISLSLKNHDNELLVLLLLGTTIFMSFLKKGEGSLGRRKLFLVVRNLNWKFRLGSQVAVVKIFFWKLKTQLIPGH